MDSEVIKFDWTDKLVDKLVDLYEERPCMYDKTHALYANRDCRIEAEREIASAFSTSGTYCGYPQYYALYYPQY